ncbi:penicillin-binding protein [Actinomyces sp. zg-332]|uniref:transglycosylase domain-containing protein n=1 Tax=Actinomyces sp. zg-332 TaxID=2708340 RepID=UPI00141D7B50|nr:transglycosylase domain-containing protein [Actinomyces sp. zg-332]QPK94120.1 penicillin-binding protein [Actinomyces sp. zg-332]
MSPKPSRSSKRKTKVAKAKRPLGKRILRGVLLTGALSVLAGLLVFVLTYLLIPIPKPSELALAQTTKVYYSDGKTLMGEFSKVNRTIIDTKTIPKYVGDAVIASEDRNFYSNNGIDIKGIIRAAVNNVTGGARQGASTLTQQYVENYYSGSRGGYIGKIRESVLALKINSRVSKQEILDSYLNTIYFGRGAYGIEAAAKAYFNVSASELTLSQAALLAGLIPAPSAWDPAIDANMAKARWNRVIKYMSEDGMIAAKEKKDLKFPETIEPTVVNKYSGSTGYLLEHVRRELENRGKLSGDDLDTNGYKIVTTIDKDKQDAAVDAVAKLPSGHAENMRTALVSIDSKTGAIKAEYGGEDYLKIQRNAVIDDYVLPGSTFKAFALIAGLQNGESLNSYFPGNSPMTIDGYTLKNYGNVSYGNISLLRAWVYSANTPFVALNKKIGPEKTMDTAIKAGIPANSPGLGPYLSNTLGASAVHPIDLAKAFTTIASGGIKYGPYIVENVVDTKGNVVYKGKKPGERVFPEDLINEVHYAGLQATREHGGAVRTLNHAIAGKTGTAEDNKAALFSGWTPSLYTLVAMYQVGPKGEPETITPFGGYREIYGESFPTIVWKNYMAVVLKNQPNEQFPKRSGKYLETYNQSRYLEQRRLEQQRKREEEEAAEQEAEKEQQDQQSPQTEQPANPSQPSAPGQ